MRPEHSPGSAESWAQSSGGGTHPAHLIICDDHRIVAEGLVKLVEPPHIVTAVTTSGNEAAIPERRSACTGNHHGRGPGRAALASSGRNRSA